MAFKNKSVEGVSHFLADHGVTEAICDIFEG